MTQPPIPEGETLEQAIEKFCSIMGHNNPSARKAFIAGAEWQKAQAGGEWIDASITVPITKDKVLTFDGDTIRTCYFDIDTGKWLRKGLKPTHWMPLPEPPTPQ